MQSACVAQPNKSTADMKQKVDLKAKAKRHADRMTDREDRRLTRAAQNDPDNPPLRAGAKLRPLRQVLPELAARGPGRPPIAKPKVQVTLRLDQDLLAAIRASGGGWQTRLNQTLRKTFVPARKRRTGS